MMTIKQYISVGLLLLLSVGAGAETVSQGQARAQAAQFMAQRGKSLSAKAPMKSHRSSSSTEPISSPSSSSSTEPISSPSSSSSTESPSSPHVGSTSEPTSYYIFSGATDGYVIISGDDRTPAVLGYSDHGLLNEDDMPEGLQWLLQLYDEQIASLPSNTPPAKNSQFSILNSQFPSPSSSVRHTIAPLLTTLWDQGDPYNLLCPQYYNADGTQGNLCATGCVATAIAQVMVYYRYPEQTRRTIPGYVQTFGTAQGDKNVRLNSIPAGSVIDWDNMLDTYHGGETEEQRQAIAQLMYWVGLGCKMGYGPSSGAGFAEGVNALINYFGYDDGTHIESRSNHTIQSWSDLLYNELATGHPVALAGTNTGGAHAFVLDGYDMDGLFHVNWGWGGMDNGYFRVDVLAPDNNSGAGASQTPDGYNMGQEAIIGLRLPDDVTAPAKAYKLTVNDWELRQGNTFFANYVNWSGVAANWNVGLGYVNDEGGLSVVGSYQTVQLSPNYYVGMSFPVRGLSEGTYHLVPISRRSGESQWQTHVNPDITYVQAVVAADGSVQLELHPVENIVMTQMSFPGNHKRGDRQTVDVTLRNQADEYYRELHLLASRTSNKGESLCRTAVTIARGGETTASFGFTPDAAGTWNVWLSTDSHGNEVVGQGQIEISNEGLGTTHSLRYVSHTVNNRSNGTVYGDRMQGKVTVMNQANEVFDGRVHLWLFKLAGDGYFYGAASLYVPMHIEPKKTAQADYYFDHLDLGATYNMSILYEEGGDITDGGLRSMGRTQAGILYWQQNKALAGLAPSATVNTPSGALAIDMSSLGSAVTTVRPNSNPNTLYLVAADAQLPAGLDGRNVVVGSHAESIALTDGYGFFAPSGFKADKASYTRTTQGGMWETIALPFGVQELPAEAQVFTFAEVYDDGQVGFESTTHMEPNIPYLLRTDDAVTLTLQQTDVTFQSTLDAPMVIGTESHRFTGTTVSERQSGVFVLNPAEGIFEYTPQQTAVQAFRAYFTAPQEVGTIVLPQAGADGMAQPTLKAQEGTGVLYDLQGRRLTTPLRPGLYIRDGKTIFLK